MIRILDDPGYVGKIPKWVEECYNERLKEMSTRTDILELLKVEGKASTTLILKKLPQYNDTSIRSMLFNLKKEELIVICDTAEIQASTGSMWRNKNRKCSVYRLAEELKTPNDLLEQLVR